MAVPVGQYVRMDGGTTLFSGFSIGDTIKITGSSENNGIYTINNIDASGGNSYMGVTGPRITDNAGDANCIISNISSKVLHSKVLYKVLPPTTSYNLLM